MVEKIVAVGFLTQKELGLLGPAFDRAWPVDKAAQFDEIIKAIDEAEERLNGETAGPPGRA